MRAMGATGATGMTAAVACGLALAVLGVQWDGRPGADGEWVDGVTLAQWAVFWLLLAALAAVAARHLPTARHQVLALVPVLSLLGYQLWGALGPIPIVVYTVPTAGAWLAGCAAGRNLQRPLARSMKK